MTSTVERTKELITLQPRQLAIEGLIKLQRETPQKYKHIPRLACLSLMEMNHDWESIRKLVVQWKLVNKFGKDLVIRMRKRVNQEPGAIEQNQQIILQELDRLNDKNWRQYSPKRSFPDYTELLAQPQPQPQSLPQAAPLQKVESQESKQQKKQEKMPIVKQQSNRVSQFFQQKNIEKPTKDKQIMTRGIFSKQFPRNQYSSDKNERSNDRPSLAPQRDLNPTLQNSRKLSNSIQKPSQTPSKQSHKQILIKYGGTPKIKEQAPKDQFSFSAVKSRQVLANPLSSKKQTLLNDSFLNFSHDSIPKDNKIQGPQRADKGDKGDRGDRSIFEEFGGGDGWGEDQWGQRASFSHAPTPIIGRSLFSEQELALIQMSVPPKNYIKEIFIAQKTNAMELLRNRV